MKIGILNLQGAVTEHQQMLQNLGVETVLIKNKTDLTGIDGLILPGGESTVMKKLLIKNNLFAPLKELIQAGLPTFGTCAGMVLLSQTDGFNLINGEIVRNGFGRQKQSFEESLNVQGLNAPFHAVFIRAPYLSSVNHDVQVLAKIDDKIVAAKKDHVLVTAFHPELTNDPSLHRLFLDMI
ncbi:pyridoxal 5'-phosphate synthase glutaminase subunit PdxT [Fructilactobacillus frigidiflavus]|uniref:pyridoxal 5'-phosphate synthase glutaminase subunit PdxT n=1 Tax=Fructilactobacillus frigidiflavus TaxID=3242688 RepID=UPI0037574EF5